MKPTRESRCPQSEHTLHRRSFLQGTGAGAAGLLTFGGLGVSAETELSAAVQKKRKQVLFIWLAGGASQFEMWDPKPGRETGGPFRTIPSKVPGYHVGELMPKLAGIMDQFAVVRSLNTGITAHEPAADFISTGRPKEAVLEYPEIGVILAKELAVRESRLPGYVSLFTSSEGRRRPATGFLGGQQAPLLLEHSLKPSHIELPPGLTANEHAGREQLRSLLSRRFSDNRAGGDLVEGYNAAYAKVRGLMQADHLFDLDKEPSEQRERYGRTQFGEQCLLARRLLEAGVPVVKIARGFWDSHHDNFESHRELVPDFDHVMSVLIGDLEDRGLLDSTLVIVLSEFGRTPKINKDMGRDHYAAAWSFALAGAGVKGGAVYGKTDEDGKTVTDGEANAWDVAATIYQALGIDPMKHYHVGPRPVPLAKEDAIPITDILS